MAGFNQEPNIIDPNYLGFSRGTQGAHIANLPEPVGLHKGTEVRYEANKSGALAIGALAEGLGPLASGIKQAYLEGAREAVDTEVGGIRDQFNKDLDKAINTGGKVPPVMAYAAEDEDTGTGGAPDAIGEAERTLGTYASARAGKYMTEREYAIATEAKLQELRERYPGYTEDIDRMVKNKLGFDPANMRWQASLNALIAMKSAAQANASAADKELKFALTHTSSDVQNAYKSGQLTRSQFLSKAYENVGNKFNLELEKANYERAKELKADDQEAALKVYSMSQNDRVKQSFADFALRMEGPAAQLLNDMVTGKTVDPTKERDWPILLSHLNQWRQQMLLDGSEVRKQAVGSPYGPSFAQVLTPDKLDEIDQKSMAFVDAIIGGVTGKADISLLAATTAAVNQVKSQDQWEVLKDKGALRVKTIEDLYGPSLTPFILNGAMQNAKENPNIKGGIYGMLGVSTLGGISDGSFKGLGQADSALQPEPRQRKALIDALHTSIVTKNTLPAGITKSVDALTSPDTWDYISKMSDKAPFTGGKSDRRNFFEQFINPQVAESVYSTKNPATILKYNRFAKELFVQQSKQDSSTLQQIITDRDNVAVKYDPKGNRLNIEYSAPTKESPLFSALDYGLAASSEAAVNRMNLRLKQIEPVLANEGDVPEGSLELLGITGLNLEAPREGDFITKAKRAIEGTPKSRAQGGGYTPAKKGPPAEIVKPPVSSRAGKTSFMQAPDGKLYYQTPDGQYYEVSVG